MKLNIGNHDFTELWNGVLYKALSDYPNVSDNEMKDIIDFDVYEKSNGRECEITADRQEILDYVLKEMKNPDKYKDVCRPEIIKECTACTVRGGCMTDFVCHTAPLENAIRILKSGSLLSAVNARKLPDTVLQKEDRNAAKDPADFFSLCNVFMGKLASGRQVSYGEKTKEKSNTERNGCRIYARSTFLLSI